MAYNRQKFYNKKDIDNLLADLHAEILGLKDIINSNISLKKTATANTVIVKYNWFGKLLLWMATL